MARTIRLEHLRGLLPICSLAPLVCGACHAPAEREGHTLSVNWGESETDPDDAFPQTTTRVGFGYGFGEQTSRAVIPVLGVTIGNDDSVFVTTEVRKNLWIREDWVLTPSTGFGYFEDGDILRLGGEFQFRSGVELSYQFSNGMRLGVAFFHISNARIYEENPGSNEALITWTVPIP